MHGELKDYRQPMVTSVGILLGFLLNFLAGWGIRVGGAFGDAADVVILSSVMTAVVLLVVTLFRMLRADLGSRDPGAYYRTTLRIYIAAITLAFRWPLPGHPPPLRAPATGRKPGYRDP